MRRSSLRSCTESRRRTWSTHRSTHPILLSSILKCAIRRKSKWEQISRGAIRSRLLWVVATGLAVIAVSWGIEGVSNAFLALGLVTAALAGWMFWGLTATNMNSQGMTYALPHERRMHNGMDDARRTHSVGIRVIGMLAVVSAFAFGLGFALRQLAAKL